MNMIEKVARAFARSRVMPQPWTKEAEDKWVDDYWMNYKAEAKAGIEAMSDWQPMETAPKDGTFIDLAVDLAALDDKEPCFCRYADCQWDSERKCWIDDRRETLDWHDQKVKKYWMPIASMKGLK